MRCHSRGLHAKPCSSAGRCSPCIVPGGGRTERDDGCDVRLHCRNAQTRREVRACGRPPRRTWGSDRQHNRRTDTFQVQQQQVARRVAELVVCLRSRPMCLHASESGPGAAGYRISDLIEPLFRRVARRNRPISGSARYRNTPREVLATGQAPHQHKKNQLLG